MQTLVVDAIVAAAASWLVWSFAPGELRRWLLAPIRRLGQGRRAIDKPAQGCGCADAGKSCDAAGRPLHADELGG